jgi:hypothetical protein
MTTANEDNPQSIDADEADDELERSPEDSEPSREDDRAPVAPGLPVEELAEEQAAEDLGAEKREEDLNP